MIWKAINAVVKTISGSPFHKIISNNILVLNILGTKTGKTYAIPVSYLETKPGMLFCITDRSNVWWRNIGHNQIIKIRYKGNLVDARIDVNSEDLVVAIDHLSQLCNHSRVDGFFAGIGYVEGKPIQLDIERVAPNMIPITIQI
tara:strand:- start:343 stop:774 length:432 start_codon:yes stop_codon:yes gene_type:complete